MDTQQLRSRCDVPGRSLHRAMDQNQFGLLKIERQVRYYFERGMPISINTDDPKMFNNSLAEEYQWLVEKRDFSQDDIRTLILNAVESSWLPDARKAALREQLTFDPNWRN